MTTLHEALGIPPVPRAQRLAWRRVQLIRRARHLIDAFAPRSLATEGPLGRRLVYAMVERVIERTTR